MQNRCNASFLQQPLCQKNRRSFLTTSGYRVPFSHNRSFNSSEFIYTKTLDMRLIVLDDTTVLEPFSFEVSVDGGRYAICKNSRRQHQLSSCR
jgi:hypothetical protein